MEQNETERDQIAHFLGQLSTRARTHDVRIALAYAMAAVLRGDDKPGQRVEPPEDLWHPLFPTVRLPSEPVLQKLPPRLASTQKFVEVARGQRCACPNRDRHPVYGYCRSCGGAVP